MRIRNKKIIYVDSSKRKSGTDSNFEISVQLPVNHRFSKVCILQIVLPKSWYVVQDGYNTFSLIEDSIESIIEIPPKNYNRRSLSILLSELLNTKSPNGWSYDITYPNAAIEGDNGHYTFTVSNNNSQPSFKFSDNGIHELLGFKINSTNLFVDNTLESVNITKIQSEDVVRIHSNISNNEGDDILLEVYGTSDPCFTNIVWICPDIEAYSKDLTIKNTSVYRFHLTNEDEQELTLNGLNYTFTLLLYEPENSVIVREPRNGF